MLDGLFGSDDEDVALGPGAVWLRGFARSFEAALLPALRSVTDAAPFRHMLTPGGRRMSVAMTSCGRLGWVSDGRGYRYDANDPETGRPWPPMPPSFAQLAEAAAARAGFEGYRPDSCLVNRYEPGAKLSLHQDRDERDFSAPIVSVSLGLRGGLPVRWHASKRCRPSACHSCMATWSCGVRRRDSGITACCRSKMASTN